VPGGRGHIGALRSSVADWSPDGQWIAFASSRGDPAGHHAVFVVDRAGRHLIQLTDHGLNAQHPVWSPDGKWLVFSAQPDKEVDLFGLARISVPKLPR
jgi:Tol biopolymer transport system component